MRQNIAHLAARLIAQDGLEDYALAKRKAARQAGVPDTRELPDNEEIEAALRVYRDLYQSEHPAQLRELRELALEVMDELAAFNPYLTGPVLTGNAGKYADIYLQLFTDDVKRVEHYLLNEQGEFRSGDTTVYAGDRALNAPLLSFERNGVEIHLTLLSVHDQRSRVRTTAAGKPLERASRAAVARLLDGAKG